MRICFLVGSLAISGGTYVILQHAAHLRRRGHAVTLAVQDPMTPDMLTWHDETRRLECVESAEARKRSYDVVIATWWKTALEAGGFQADCHAYFVQSIESRFYPPGDGPVRRLVERTYELPVAYVTEADWIRGYLAERYGQDVAVVRNGIRKDVYGHSGDAVCPRPSPSGMRVLVEGHLQVPFKNTALAIKLARQAGLKDVWLLTGSPVTWLPGVARVFSRVPMTDTPAIYRSCDVLLKLSTVEGMFGPPLEMFHCGGTAVVFDVTGHDEYIRDHENALVIPRGNTDAVVAAMRRLAGDPGLLESLKSGAQRTAAEWPSWEESSGRFEHWLHETALRSRSDMPGLRQLAADALREYREQERARRRRDPRLACTDRLVAAARRLPPAFKRACRQGAMVWEVIAPGTRVG